MSRDCFECYDDYENISITIPVIDNTILIENSE
jgi:hypothetical protein